MGLAEFSYQCFQAYDWLHLHRTQNCLVQVRYSIKRDRFRVQQGRATPRGDANDVKWEILHTLTCQSVRTVSGFRKQHANMSARKPPWWGLSLANLGTPPRSTED